MTKENKPGPDARPRVLAEPVSDLTTNRLSVYLQCLNALDASGVRTISSRALAEQFHLNAAQIRKDLATFGEFGVRGVGYYVKELRRHLREILGLDRGVRVAIIGAGNLGPALADYPGFKDDGFAIVALFDTPKDKVGRRSRSDRIEAPALNSCCAQTRSVCLRQASGSWRRRASVTAITCSAIVTALLPRELLRMAGEATMSGNSMLPTPAAGL